MGVSVAENFDASGSKSNVVVWVVILIIALALGGGAFWYIRGDSAQDMIATEKVETDKVGITTTGPPVVDLSKVDEGGPQVEKMEERKKEHGLTKSVDAVVREEESVKVGDTTVQMKQIVSQIEAKKKGQPLDATAVLEESIGPAQEGVVEAEILPELKLGGQAQTTAGSAGAGGVKAAKTGMAKAAGQTKTGGSAQGGTIARETPRYGLHLVRSRENLWKVHLAFLREYFARHGINIPPGADRPKAGGKSSGIARILKFAEREVFVYNVRTKKLDDDLDMIRPNEKIVIFNITKLDEILRDLDEGKIEKLRLEGGKLYTEG